MAGDTIVTVIGNLTADPELRFTGSGAAVVNFTVASTPRHYDKNTNEWVDDETLYLRCSQWRQPAENLTESLTRGSRVIVQGRLKQRSYETKEGEKRTVVELDADEVGASMTFATVKVNRATRSDGNGQQRPAARSNARPAAQSPVDDPWGSAPPATSRTAYADDIPF